MTVFGILRIIPLVSSASSTGERLETGNAVIIVLALLEFVHLQAKQIAHGKTAGKVEYKNGGDSVEEKKIEKLYELLERSERERDEEAAAALRWAIFQLESR